MENIKVGLAKMLNKALELEHAAMIQYLAHAEHVQGLHAEKIRERLLEIASDEEKHAGKFRTLIADFLGGTVSMGMAPTHAAGKNIPGILKVNLGNEKEAIDFYKQIYQKVKEQKESLPYEFETLEHEIRHIIIDEQEHVTELSLLLGV